MYRMKSAVLFIIFKRADTTKRVFGRIREAQPPRLYIAADGPRKDRPDEVEKCRAARKVVETIDWPCEVHRLYREENLGCGRGVSSAITWFFDHEEQGIIIEDDILPHIEFFKYCDEMLNRYKEDEKIQMICGRSCLYAGCNSDVSYYLSSCGQIWGWASWKRVWDTYVFDIGIIPRDKYIEILNNRLPLKSVKYFVRNYNRMLKYEVDTWDYQFCINWMYYNRYCLLPVVNMVENIGFGSADATHTSFDDRNISRYKASSPYPLKHPAQLMVDDELERMTMINAGCYIKPFYLRIFNRLKSYTRFFSYRE